MASREVELPPYIEEGALAGALHALGRQRTPHDELLQGIYDTAGRAILDCMSVLPEGEGSIRSSDGRILLYKSSETERKVQIYEGPEVQRGFYRRLGRISIRNKGFYEKDGESLALETRWELTADRAKASEKWGEGGTTEIHAVDLATIQIIGTSAILELAGFRRELGMLASS